MTRTDTSLSVNGGRVKRSYRKPSRATWTYNILPFEDRKLVEEAPFDLDTRAMFCLVKPIRDFLDQHEHKLEIDRGDFGDGDEHFSIVFYDINIADAFSVLCHSL